MVESIKSIMTASVSTQMNSSEKLNEICPKCGEKKWVQVEMVGVNRIMPVSCKCRRDALEAERKRMAQEEEKRRIEKLLGDSQMDKKCYSWTFANWDEKLVGPNNLKIARRYVDNWEQVKADNHGMLLYGPTGTGKTYMAAAIAHALIKQNVPVGFISAIDIINKIYKTYGSSEDGASRFINGLNNASLLIIDDLGAEHKSKSGKEKEIIYQIIDNRLRINKPLIITSNHPLQALRDRLDYDGIDRVVDRISEMCVPIKIDGVSIRQAKAADKRKSFMETLQGE